VRRKEEGGVAGRGGTRVWQQGLGEQGGEERRKSTCGGAQRRARTKKRVSEAP
jgi:hypothetical protein